MSDKNELRRLIEADQDGELGPEDRARVVAALRDDPELAAEAAELRRLRDIFRAVPPVRAPEGFREGVLDRAATRTAAAAAGAGEDAADARSGFRLVRAAPWIAGLAAACLLAVMLGPWSLAPWSDDGARHRDTDVATADAPAAEKSLELTRDDESLRRQAFEQQEAGSTVGELAPARRARGAVAPEPVADAVDGRRAGGKSRAQSGPARPQPPATTTAADVPEREEAAPAEARDPSDEILDLAGERDDATARGTGLGEIGSGEIGSPSKDAAAPPARVEKPEPPPVPPAVTAEAPAPQPVVPDRSREFGGRTKESKLARVAAPTRRYVVFEDEDAARRFVASLRAAIEAKSAGGAKKGPVAASEADSGASAGAGAGAGDGDGESRDDGPDQAGGPTTGGPDTSGPVTGGVGGSESGRSLGSGAGFADADRLAARTSAPRVLERVTLATTDPIVGRVFARAPQGGVFGESVAAELLDLAEASAKLRKAEAGRSEVGEELPRDDGGVVGVGGGGGVAGGATRGTAGVAESSDPPADEPGSEGGADLRRARRN